MAGGFSEIKLTWDGTTYTIPPRRVLEAISAVEEVITLDVLQRYMHKGSPPLAKIAMAYGALLRFAGAEAENDDVYSALFSGNSGAVMASTVQTLLLLMLPPDSIIQNHAAKGGKGGNVSAADMSSSKSSIRPQSRKNGARRPNSGH